MTAPYFSPSTSSNPIEYVVFKAALMIKGQVRGAEFWMKPLDVKTGLPYGQKRRANKRVSFWIVVNHYRKIRRIHWVNHKFVIP